MRIKDACIGIRKWLILILVGKMKVVLNSKISDYDVELNAFNTTSNEHLFNNNFVFNMANKISEEMYCGAPGKEVTRVGNSYVLKFKVGGC